MYTPSGKLQCYCDQDEYCFETTHMVSQTKLSLTMDLSFWQGNLPTSDEKWCQVCVLLYHIIYLWLGWLNATYKLSRSQWMLWISWGRPAALSELSPEELHNTTCHHKLSILVIVPAHKQSIQNSICWKPIVKKEEANEVQHHNWHSKSKEMPVGRKL